MIFAITVFSSSSSSARYPLSICTLCTVTVLVIPEMAQVQQLQLLLEQPAQLEQVGGEFVDTQVSGWEPAGDKNTHIHLPAPMFVIQKFFLFAGQCINN